jgi:hypothetical protein
MEIRARQWYSQPWWRTPGVELDQQTTIKPKYAALFNSSTGFGYISFEIVVRIRRKTDGASRTLSDLLVAHNSIDGSRKCRKRRGALLALAPNARVTWHKTKRYVYGTERNTAARASIAYRPCC